MANAQKIAQEEVSASAQSASPKASTAQETITSTSQASALEETAAPTPPATATEQTTEQFAQLQANELQANAQLLIDQASTASHCLPPHHPTGKEGENPAIEATPEIIAAVQELRRIEELKKKLLELEEARRCQIKSFMGLHPLLTKGAFTLVSWKSVDRKSLNIQAFKSELPDLYNSYLTDINVRVFRLV